MPRKTIQGIAAHRLDSRDFARIRTKLGKSRRELAELLGVSLKAVESYEQGWRKVPVHVERVLYYLLCKLGGGKTASPSCWTAKKCPSERRTRCIAFSVKEGAYCWFFTGRLCAQAGTKKSNSEDAETGLGACYGCAVFLKMLNRTGVL
jgi:transcriptional regulator with XRE-family HTH domain